MRLFLTILIFSTFSYAVTPFSLENVKSVNIVIADKRKVLQKQTILKIEKSVESKLQELGIKTQTDDFINFIIKIDTIKLEEQFAVYVSLFIVESVNPLRDKELENVAITYKQDDFFIADLLDEEVYESAVEFLLYSFEEQYLEEQD
ncbi:MAG TPA: hypothetical protein EYG93_00120 [Sulfurospirillum arcachonense]|nr:hypothetical protein [Sulfurospirillum arcachonense]HIP43728.1 hypothetical protein [Sulfurospirillum arcachonense]